MSKPSVTDARVLVVEDEVLIAMDVEQICLEFGAKSVLIASTVSAASALDLTAFDVAILDRNVAGESTHAIARNLDEIGIPFVFTSGFPDELESREFPSAPLVQKPYSTESMLDALVQVLLQTARPFPS